MNTKIKNIIISDYRNGNSINKLAIDYGYPETVIKRMITPKTPIITSAIISIKKSKSKEKKESNELINKLVKNMPTLNHINTTKLKSPKMIEAGKKAYITRMKNRGIIVITDSSPGPIGKYDPEIEDLRPKTWKEIWNIFVQHLTTLNFKDWLEEYYKVPHPINK